MVFKRRDPRTWLEFFRTLFYPRGGWSRAIQYLRLRVHRLPGTPESIARGIFAGAFTVFTPFFGLHFLLAAFLARLMRGNMLAALLATFFGNPLTYLPFALISLHTGHFLLGTDPGGAEGNIFNAFAGAWRDLQHNFLAMFSEERAHWHQLHEFYSEVFYPFMVGSIIPGLIFASITYYLSVPVIRSFQKRRLAKLQAKMEKLKNQAAAEEAPKEGGAE